MATTQADPSGGGTSSLAPFRHAIQAPQTRGVHLAIARDPFQATFGGRQFSPHNSANALGLWLALRY